MSFVTQGIGRAAIIDRVVESIEVELAPSTTVTIDDSVLGADFSGSIDISVVSTTPNLNVGAEIIASEVEVTGEIEAEIQ